jgi:hypothetical protein
VQLSPLGTAATNRPIVPAPGDHDDGEIIIIWFVRLLALRPLLAYCASLG